MSARYTTNPNMLRGESDADFCRRMGWGVGQCLTGDEGYGPETIMITGIGERLLLAKRIAPHSDWGEGSWTLACRDWKPAAPTNPVETGETGREG